MWPPNALRYIDGAVTAPGRLAAPAPRRMILLIHGYNNDRAQAEQSYRALVTMLPDGDREAVWEFFWPGFIERWTGSATDTPLLLAPHRDNRGTESNQLISALAYSTLVSKARDVGLALGQYLDGIRPDGLILVAHSLGCRVALEATRFMVSRQARGRVPLAGACLMAAAVPTFMVDAQSSGAPGPLRDGACAIRRSFVLYSTNDYVLRTAFRLGQTAAGPGEGFMPEAVGVSGGPETPWSVRGDTGLGHSGYWTHPSTAPATLRALGHAGSNSLRELPSFQRVRWTESSAEDLPARGLNERDWRRDGRRSRLG